MESCHPDHVGDPILARITTGVAVIVGTMPELLTSDPDGLGGLYPRPNTDFFSGLNNCDDEIAICQEKRYQEYLKSQYLFFYDYPCFNEFFEKYNKQNQEIINYLNKNKLKFVNHNQYSNYPEYGRLRVRDEDISKDNVVSFNRILTKEEWVKLNTNCKKNHCFSIDSTYETYQNVYEKYKAAGYDVKLEYNCPKCCSNGKNEIEFWFRFNV